MDLGLQSDFPRMRRGNSSPGELLLLQSGHSLFNGRCRLDLSDLMAYLDADGRDVLFGAMRAHAQSR